MIIGDEYLIVFGINFGAELVILQALIADGQRLFLGAGRDAFSCLEVPLFALSAVLKDPIVLAGVSPGPELSLECRMGFTSSGKRRTAPSLSLRRDARPVAMNKARSGIKRPKHLFRDDVQAILSSQQ
ncbi:hypothetical protein GGD64_007725 [Bradyrhizobium sp. CIR3A]|nr:hypothetical protein [Bradyrhizobium sp. CIR3A]